MQRRWVASPDYRRVIEQIKAVREAKGLSQREVARRLGKAVSFVNKIELLERRLDILEFIVLARALEMPPHELIAALAEQVPELPDF
jgi:transcriptional regulator with XRE-family HTH domain